MTSANNYSGYLPLDPTVISHRVKERQPGVYIIDQTDDTGTPKVLYADKTGDLRARLTECDEKMTGDRLFFRFCPCESKDEADQEWLRLKAVIKAKFPDTLRGPVW